MAVFEPVIEEREEISNGYIEDYSVDDSDDMYFRPVLLESEIVEEEPENAVEEQYYESEVLGAGSPLSDTVDSSPSVNEIYQTVEHQHYYVSQNTVYQVGEVVLNNKQFEALIASNEVSSVSGNYVTAEQFNTFSTAVISLNIIIVGILFGYFVKESIFRGL